MNSGDRSSERQLFDAVNDAVRFQLNSHLVDLVFRVTNVVAIARADLPANVSVIHGLQFFAALGCFLDAQAVAVEIREVH